jgi:hypothetical protein
MPTKVGAGGKPQAYGKAGKYSKAGVTDLPEGYKWDEAGRILPMNAREKAAKAFNDQAPASEVALSGPSSLPNGANPEIRFQQLEKFDAKQRARGLVPTFDTSEVADKFRGAVSDKPSIRIRVSAEVLDHVLTDGRFKTQHETGRSGGSFSPNLRDDHEERMFGAPKTRPVYGYTPAQTDSGRVSYENQSIYGEISVVLKPEVAARTTLTLGDSLYTPKPPAPVIATDVHKVSDERLVAAATNLGYTAPYIEAQIHGGVTVDDIDHVIFPIVTSRYLPGGGYEYVDASEFEERYPNVKIVVTYAAQDQFTMLDLQVMVPATLS